MMNSFDSGNYSKTKKVSLTTFSSFCRQYASLGRDTPYAIANTRNDYQKVLLLPKILSNALDQCKCQLEFALKASQYLLF